jgi:hypothetical protein
MKEPSIKSRAKPATVKAVPGTAGAGAPFDPTRLGNEPDVSGAAERNVRPAPAPGIPMSEAQYEKLKREAETARKQPSKHGQEDAAAKK